jgi:hypothetical protein
VGTDVTVTVSTSVGCNYFVSIVLMNVATEMIDDAAGTITIITTIRITKGFQCILVTPLRGIEIK